MNKYLEDSKDAAPFTDITGLDAAKLVASSPFEPYDVVSFDIVEARRLGVQEGSWVAVTPDDTGGSIFVQKIQLDH